MEDNYWSEIFGHQRDWVWRGWQIRYTYFRTSSTDTKSKPPLLFIHGFGASIKHWRYNLSLLAKEYRVYAIDLLGFGASRKAKTIYSTKLWTDLIYDFWQTFINEPIIMIGNSLGSLVCVLTAYNYPKIIHKIALLNLPDVTMRQEMIPKILRPIVTTVESIFSTSLFLKPLFRLVRKPFILSRWLSLAYIDKSKLNDELLDIIATPPQDENADNAFIGLCKGVNDVNFSPSMKKILPQLKYADFINLGEKR